MMSETPTRLLIRGGRLLDPAHEIDQTGDLLIENDRIVGIETDPGRLRPEEADRVIDGEGLLVTPGLIDIHVHLREPGPQHEETIATGTEAAGAGGFTTVCCMPNTSPALDSPEQIEFVRTRAAEAGHCRVFTVACATRERKGRELTDVAALARAGAVGISDDGDVVADATLMAEALRAARAKDLCFMQHCQDPDQTMGASMNAGPVCERLGLIGWPKAAEECIVERDIELNRAIGARYHAQHLSSGASAQLIRRARAAGVVVTGEVSPHHLLLTDEACEEMGPMAKMNPPLRTREDIAQLKEAVADGTITILATDHAPHPLASKQRPFAEASFGIVGVECALALYVRALIEDGVIDWPRLLAMMTIEPARLVGLDRKGFGQFRIGGPADVTLIDPDESWTIDMNAFRTTGRNCPFHGWDVTGRAVGTIVGGRIRFDRMQQRVTG